MSFLLPNWPHSIDHGKTPETLSTPEKGGAEREAKDLLTFEDVIALLIDGDGADETGLSAAKVEEDALLGGVLSEDVAEGDHGNTTAAAKAESARAIEMVPADTKNEAVVIQAPVHGESERGQQQVVNTLAQRAHPEKMTISTDETGSTSEPLPAKQKLKPKELGQKLEDRSSPIPSGKSLQTPEEASFLGKMPLGTVSSGHIPKQDVQAQIARGPSGLPTMTIGFGPLSATPKLSSVSTHTVRSVSRRVAPETDLSEPKRSESAGNTRVMNVEDEQMNMSRSKTIFDVQGKQVLNPNSQHSREPAVSKPDTERAVGNVSHPLRNSERVGGGLLRLGSDLEGLRDDGRFSRYGIEQKAEAAPASLTNQHVASVRSEIPVRFSEVEGATYQQSDPQGARIEKPETNQEQVLRASVEKTDGRVNSNAQIVNVAAPIFEPEAREIDPLGTEHAAPAEKLTFGRSVEQTPSVVVTHPSKDTGFARQVLQIVQSRGGEGQIDITLNPEELGRVRMTLSSSEGALSVIFMAEREETVELLRRHYQELEQEFHALGYGQTSFKFEQGDQRSEGENGFQNEEPSEIALEAVVKHSEIINPDSGLDIRL